MAQTVTVRLYRARLTRVTLVWVLTALVLFPVLAMLGLLMRTLQSGYLPGGAARMVLRGHDAARPGHGRPLVRCRHGGDLGAARELRQADAGRVVGRLRRDARSASCSCSPQRSWGASASAGISSIRCRSTPAARGLAWATASLFIALAIMGVGWTLWAGDLLLAIARTYRLSTRWAGTT